MPKKKLTKTQAKRKFKIIRNALYDLWADKIGYQSKSFVSMSGLKISETITLIDRADSRVK
jgi:hypothetical protein